MVIGGWYDRRLTVQSRNELQFDLLDIYLDAEKSESEVTHRVTCVLWDCRTQPDLSADTVSFLRL